MIEWLGDWLKQVILLILIAAFIDLLLPNHSLDRYVKLVMGLLIIMAILSPIFHLLSKDLDLSRIAFGTMNPTGKGMEPISQIREDSAKVKHSQTEQIRDRSEQAMAQEIKDQINRHFHITVADADVTLAQKENQWEIRQVRILLEEGKADENPANPAMKPIEPVHIQVGDESPQRAKNDEQQRIGEHISRFIADSWDLAPDQIIVTFTQPDG
ncbi:stage III sporulation protein AF [Thermoactinomyces sp. CICC 10523]|uniref:stage III sporulation protein AF n=1 Tax=Thermoactinomyces sp. CICC 10523 TaxID=2767428 RepID=UPI0018DE3029|nr:stage III sporulation protein AF [Thermoactinomyces sp. CICC 10523]MBH8596751.1 stage III sporulation protein AF [Thermoactinomyces sp. CICC 10523]